MLHFPTKTILQFPFSPLPMIYIVQKLTHQVKDTFPSFIWFPAAPNILFKSVMWRRKNIVSEPTSSSFKCGPVCIDQKLLPLIQVVWEEKWLNMLIQVSLRAVHKEICKKRPWRWPHRNLLEGSVKAWATPTLASLRGLIFRRASPSLLYGSPPWYYPQHRHINSDDFGGHLVLGVDDQERDHLRIKS